MDRGSVFGVYGCDVSMEKSEKEGLTTFDTLLTYRLMCSYVSYVVEKK